MLLELRPVANDVELEAVDAAIVALLEAVATAERGADPVALIAAAWPADSGKPSRDALIAILALPGEDRVALCDAVRADLGFASRLDDGDFEFAFPQLEEDVMSKGKDLLSGLYDSVFRRKGFASPAGGEQLTRTSFEAAFRAANPDIWICPACLGEQLDPPVRGKALLHIDHYLPKSVYSPLAVCGRNLVPLCMECNSPVKGVGDPLADGDDGPRRLPDIWFPYHRAGIDEMDVRFDPSRSDSAVVTLVGAPPDDDAASMRARLFDALFAISERWSTRLRSLHRTIAMEIAARVPNAEPLAVRRELATLAAIAADQQTLSPDAYLKARYCRWLEGDESALQALVACARDLDEP